MLSYFAKLGLSISIHALREESDKGEAHEIQRIQISIHALREESDAAADKFLQEHQYFYPRSP